MYVPGSGTRVFYYMRCQKSETRFEIRCSQIIRPPPPTENQRTQVDDNSKSILLREFLLYCQLVLSYVRMKELPVGAGRRTND